MCLFKLKTILKTRVTNLGEQSAILTSRDGDRRLTSVPKTIEVVKISFP